MAVAESKNNCLPDESILAIYSKKKALFLASVP